MMKRKYSEATDAYASSVASDHGNYGKMIILIGGLIACPLLVLPFYPEEIRYAPAFLIPAAVIVMIGLAIWAIRVPVSGEPVEWQSLMQKGSGPVLFTWCVAFVCGAVPFLAGGQLGPVQALFESVSGWTTTGLTVSDVANMPHIFLFHRSFMQYCGGLGFVVMITMVIRGRQSMSLYNAEGHPDKLQPSLRGTARVIASIYIGWLAVGTVLYLLAGMPLFAAVCHTMSALSTAGFSTEAGSIGAFGTVPIEIVTILLMLVGASNFAIVLKLVKGRFRQVFCESEVRFMTGIVILFSLLAGLDLWRILGGSLPGRLLDALFGVVTTFSTTGYSTMDYAHWPAVSLGLLAVLMIIGGCTGSTAGGIKMSRAYLLARITMLNMKRRVEPARWVASPYYIRQQRTAPIDERCKEDVLGFVTVYLLVLGAGTLLMALFAGCSLPDAAFEFTSALGTVGISNGLTAPDAPVPQLLLEMFAMVLGRLEILMVFVGIISAGKHLTHRK